MSKFLVLLFGLLLVAVGCSKNDSNPVGGGNNTPMVTTTIAGIVSDESGIGMGNVAVAAHGQTATTNERGLFVIRNVRVPQDRCFVLVEKDGYFTASRAEIPKVDGVTHMRLGLMQNEAKYSVQSSAGGTVALEEGGSVHLPANGYVTESGQSYNGTVKVAARWLDPSSDTFFRFFPGDFTARRTDGSEAFLYSYGVLNVELYGEDGSKLQLAPGKKAVLKYPIVSQMQKDAPSEMPLWFFDETIGMWKEEGKAVKQGNEYTGEVSHFTPWNCDVPAKAGTIKGRVMCSSEPVTDVQVRVGQRLVITDENGEYEARIPAGIAFSILVNSTENWGSGTAAPIPAGPLADQQILTIDIPVTPCPAYVTGTLTDCNSLPAEGIVQFSRITGYGYTIAKNGQFRIRVEPGVPFIVHALGYNTGVSDPQNLQPVGSGETFDMGTIELCPQNPITFSDITGMMHTVDIALSPDGTLLATSNRDTVNVYNATNGALIRTLSTTRGSLRLRFSNDGSKLLCADQLASGTFANATVWNTTSWQEIRSFANTGRAIFMPDGNSILGLDQGWDVVQYDIATGAELNRYKMADSLSSLIGTNANGTRFIAHANTDSQGSKIVVWDMNLNAPALTFPLGTYPMDNDLSADGSVLLTVGSNKVLFHNTTTGQVINTITAERERNTPMAVKPDGTRYIGQLNTGGAATPVGLYNVADGSLARLLSWPAAQYFSCFAYSGNGLVLAGLYNNDHAHINGAAVRIWRIQ